MTNSMLPILESLLVVQNRDQALEKLTKVLVSIPQEAKRAKERLFKDQDDMESKKSELQQKELEIKALELEIATRKDTILKLKNQQFETKKNDEYNALGNEVIRYTNDVDQLETRELEELEEVEVLKKKLKLATEKYESHRALVQGELNAMKAKKLESEARQTELAQERDKLITGVEPSALALYERLLKNKGSNVIVAANNGHCTGCHMKLVASTIVSVTKEQEIAHCENCGRMLYAG